VNRARSPFFFLTMVLLFASGAAFGVGIEVGTRDENLTRTAFFVGQIVLIPFALLILGEIAVRFGWEPKWLRVRYVGVMILDKESDDLGAQTGWLTVALPNKEMERYYADHTEFPTIEKNQLVILEVIGQYVADIKRMRGPDVAAIEAETAKSASSLKIRRDSSLLKPCYAGLSAWFWMLIAPGVAGVFMGVGIADLITRHATVSYGRYNRHYTELNGTDAIVPALIYVVIGLVFLGFNFIRWRRGWDEYDLIDQRRGWWYLNDWW
jgi:hypothetical protein